MEDEDQGQEQEPVAVDDTESAEDSATSDDGDIETSAQSDDDAEGEDEKPKPKQRRSYAKRIGQLTAEKRAAEREIDRLRAEAQQKQAAPAIETTPPKRDDFENYEDYIDSRAEYKAGQIADRKVAEIQQHQERIAQAQTETQQIAAYNEAREELLGTGVEAYSDFEEVALSDSLAISPHMADAVLVSDRGADVLYHLGKNPKLAERIAAMPPVKQLIELGKIEASLTVERKASSAPAPTRNVNQRGSATNNIRDNLSMNDWMKRRNAEVHKFS